MTDARYHELLSHLLDSDLSETDAKELRDGLEDEPRRLRDLREHLMLWELWAQEQSPERGAEAFGRGFQTRLRAELEGRVGPDAPVGVPVRRRHRRLVLTCAAAVLLLASAVAVAVLWPRSPRHTVAVLGGSAQAPIARPVRHPLPTPGRSGQGTQSPAVRLVSVQGEGVCAHCILHLTNECQLAIRVREKEREELFLVNESAASRDFVPACCANPVPMLAQGSVHTENGRLYLATTRLEVLP
jgi:hypothetical protein